MFHNKLVKTISAPVSKSGITLDDIYRRISILDNSMESLNEILKTELKGIRRALNINKK